MEFALANLLYCFDWELPIGITSEAIETDGMPGLTSHPKSALSLLAKKYVSTFNVGGGSFEFSSC